MDGVIFFDLITYKQKTLTCRHVGYVVHMVERLCWNMALLWFFITRCNTAYSMMVLGQPDSSVESGLREAHDQNTMLEHGYLKAGRLKLRGLKSSK